MVVVASTVLENAPSSSQGLSARGRTLCEIRLINPNIVYYPDYSLGSREGGWVVWHNDRAAAS